MQQKDVQICDLLKNKDAKGMEFLFEEYYKPLVVWGDTFLNDVSRSEDLVQDFLIKLWEKRIGDADRSLPFFLVDLHVLPPTRFSRYLRYKH